MPRLAQGVEDSASVMTSLRSPNTLTPWLSAAPTPAWLVLAVTFLVAPRRRGRSRDAERADRSAGAGVRLDAVDHLARHLGQHPALRLDGPVRRRAHAASRHSAHDDRRTRRCSPWGVALATRITAPWQLVLVWGVVVGPGSGMVALVLGATVVNRWFVARRGLAMGLLTASTATGQLVFLPLLAAVIERSRMASRGVRHGGRRGRCAIPIVALLLRERPADLGLPPFGGEPRRARGRRRRQSGAGRPRRARRRRRGRATSGCSSPRSSSAARRPTAWSARISFPAAHDHGIPEVRAAGLLALMGVFDLVGTTGIGMALGSLEQPASARVVLRLRGLSLLFLPFALGGSGDRALGLRRLVRARLDRHRAADGASSRPTPSARLGRRSCSAGSGRGTRSARRSPRSAPAGFARRWATISWRSGPRARSVSSPRCWRCRWARRPARAPPPSPVEPTAGSVGATAGRDRLTITPHMPPRCATLTTCFCDARPRIATPYSLAAKPITV